MNTNQKPQEWKKIPIIGEAVESRFINRFTVVSTGASQARLPIWCVQFVDTYEVLSFIQSEIDRAVNAERERIKALIPKMRVMVNPMQDSNVVIGYNSAIEELLKRLEEKV